MMMMLTIITIRLQQQQQQQYTEILLVVGGVVSVMLPTFRGCEVFRFGERVISLPEIRTIQFFLVI